MRHYSDKDLNRILDEADELLANIQRYETPEEERARKEREAKEREAKERRRLEEEQRRAAEEAARQAAEAEAKRAAEDAEIARQLAEAEQIAGISRQTEEDADAPDGGEAAETDAEETESGQESAGSSQTDDAAAGWGAEALWNEPAEGEVNEDDRWAAFLAERQKADDDQLQRKAEREARKRQKAEEKAAAKARRAEAKVQKPPEPPAESADTAAPDVPKAMEPEGTEPEAVKPEDTEPEPAERTESAETGRMREAVSGSEPASIGWCAVFAAISWALMELTAHIGVYGTLNRTILYPLLFAAAAGCIAAIAASFLPTAANRAIYILLTAGCGLYFDLQIVYHKVTGAFFQLTQLPDDLWLLRQSPELTADAVRTALPCLAVMFLPLVLWAIVGRYWLRFERGTWMQRLIALFAGGILAAGAILLLDLCGYDAGSPYMTFYHYDGAGMMEQAGEQLGILLMTALELLNIVV